MLRGPVAFIGLLGISVGATGRAAELTYVQAGDVHEVSIVPAPLPQVAFGAFSVAVLEAAAGRPAGPAAPVAVIDRGPATAPLVGELFGDATARQRVAAIRLRRTFQVGGELPRLKVLRLRVKYQDGLIATLNDVEIARRNVAVDAAPDELAQRARGGEWESIFMPAGQLLRPGENVLSVEVRPSVSRLAPVVDVELQGSDSAHLIRGPLLGRVTATSATVVFETDVPALGEVRTGGRVLSSGGEPATRHVVALEGLAADQEVTYQVAVRLGEDEETTAPITFHTPPAEGEPVRFVVYGDVRGGHVAHADIVRAIEGEAVDFVVGTGDWVQRGTDESDWQKFFEITGRMLAHTAFYPTMGNHDLGTMSGTERRFEDVFALPDRPADCPVGSAWYSFQVSGVHFAILDSTHYSDERQLAWLDADLTRARAAGARALFISVHHGPFARGPHGGDPLAVARYVPLFVRHGVAVVFSGHDHIYQRGRMLGLNYVVTGGGGAPLYPIVCGVAGRPACRTDDGAIAAGSTYHYVLVEVFRDDLRLCARRADGTPVEDCVRIDLPKP